MNSIIRAASRLALGTASRFSSKPIAVVNKTSTISKRWAHNLPTTYDFTRERIMLILRLFDKIDPEKLTLDSHFQKDLGLDSLDHVEIIMMLEDDFRFEIPDKDMEALVTPAHILRYLTDKEEAYKELQDMHAHHHDHGHGHEDMHIDGHRHHLIDPKRKFSTSARDYTEKDDDEMKSHGLYDEKIGKNQVYKTTFYAEPVIPVTIEDVQSRVMKVLSKYDKIDSSKLELSSHFVDELGLDSLDHVEIMMELEDEFNIEIPDQEAEKLMRPAAVAGWIFHKLDARGPNAVDRPF